MVADAAGAVREAAEDARDTRRAEVGELVSALARAARRELARRVGTRRWARAAWVVGGAASGGRRGAGVREQHWANGPAEHYQS
jgi:hypothetical protein